MNISHNFNSYVALIGDIRASRKIEDRDGAQKNLRDALGHINEKYSKDIASKFTITLGDEFQGLLLHGENIMSIISEIERKLYPVELRFGIGIGEISTRIDPEISIGADGPGYHRARAAILFLKKNEKKKQSGKSDVRIETDVQNQSAAELINVILSLMTAMKRSWTDRQRQVIWHMLEHGVSQSEAAQSLGITQSSVQKHLASGNYYTYTEAMKTVSAALAETRRDNA
jgi:DNA-binding CsgD family transcriptional regulator